MAASLNKQDDKIVYSRQYTVAPFFFSVFPGERDRFSIILISSPDSPVIQKLFSFLINSHVDEDIIPAKTPHEASLELTNKDLPDEKLKNKLIILDLSPEGKFSHLHPAVIHAGKREWYDKHLLKRLLIPNTLQRTNQPGNWSKNYSHTIWLASSIDQVPRTVSTNAHMLFMTEPAEIALAMKNRIGTDHAIADDLILVFSTTLKQDDQLMTLPKKRFT